MYRRPVERLTDSAITRSKNFLRECVPSQDLKLKDVYNKNSQSYQHRKFEKTEKDSDPTWHKA